MLLELNLDKIWRNDRHTIKEMARLYKYNSV